MSSVEGTIEGSVTVPATAARQSSRAARRHPARPTADPDQGGVRTRPRRPGLGKGDRSRHRDRCVLGTRGIPAAIPEDCCHLAVDASTARRVVRAVPSLVRRESPDRSGGRSPKGESAGWLEYSSNGLRPRNRFISPRFASRSGPWHDWGWPALQLRRREIESAPDRAVDRRPRAGAAEQPGARRSAWRAARDPAESTGSGPRARGEGRPAEPGHPPRCPRSTTG